MSEILSLLTWGNALWVAIIGGIVVLIGYYMNHKFTQIREKEAFERELAKQHLEDLYRKIAEKEKKHDELKGKVATTNRERRYVEFQALLLLEQIKNELPGGLEEVHQEFLKRKEMASHLDNEALGNSASWFINETERLLNQDEEE